MMAAGNDNALMRFPMSPADEPEEGRCYLHHEGGLYRIICVARFSEDRRQYGVVYLSLERGTRWIRPLEMFLEPVLWPDGIIRPRYIPKPAALPQVPENQQH